ncbi:MAG: D-alanyl-D-alanine carboxypeptidase [Steroidobacteraceae bacterium]|jgi:D-alanyl-D-alanine carboxypeptidase (penicillin-binding protein 5/6)|nr:D-alanyl-D-alanine carboxypeptidase [Steroidobacteraceae bacterium]
MRSSRFSFARLARPAFPPFALLLAGALAPLVPAAAAVPVPKPPTVDVRSYIVVDYETGRVLAAMNPDARMEPASITKVMTAYGVFKAIAEKRLALQDPVMISEHAWRSGGAGSGGSSTFVQVNTTVPVETLLKGMIIQSGNDASIALAEKVGGTEDAFAQMMNTYARQLGMKSSNFTNSTGLPDPNLYTTARDIVTLARAVIREHPQYYKWYSEKEFVWNGIKQQNRNGLLGRDPSVDGIKTGHTESAGYCLLTSAKRGDMRLVSVVFGADSFKGREDASAALLNYGFTFFETAKVKGRRETVATARVYKGAEDEVAVGPARDVVVTTSRGAAGSLKTSFTLREPLVAPLAANQVVGEMVVSDGNEVVAKVPLYPAKAVAEGGLFSRLSDSVSLWMR